LQFSNAEVEVALAYMAKERFAACCV